jgi:hypothetical protein
MTEKGGLHYEQTVYNGVLQDYICTLPQGIKTNQASDHKRVLCQYWVQSEICYTQIEWFTSGEVFFSSSASKKLYLWVKGYIGSQCCLEGSRISLEFADLNGTYCIDSVFKNSLYFRDGFIIFVPMLVTMRKDRSLYECNHIISQERAIISSEGSRNFNSTIVPGTKSIADSIGAVVTFIPSSVRFSINPV